MPRSASLLEVMYSRGTSGPNISSADMYTNVRGEADVDGVLRNVSRTVKAMARIQPVSRVRVATISDDEREEHNQMTILTTVSIQACITSSLRPLIKWVSLATT